MSILSYCTTDWMDSTMKNKCLFGPMYLILLSNLSYCTMDRMDGMMESKCPFRSTLSYVYPILLYHGQDGQYDKIQWSIQIYLRILLSIPSYCAMDKIDRMTESKCPFRSTLSYCPSYPIVPWTG